jgi:hypothetical protein
MGKKINHIKIDVGVNSRNTKDIWQRAYFKVSVNRTKFQIERFSASIAPSTSSHANQEHETSAEFGEASSGTHRNFEVSKAASTFRKPSKS